MFGLQIGYVIVDGNSSLFATVLNGVNTVLHQFIADLPRTHGRGGQSAERFKIRRLQARQEYVTKVAECANQQFIINDNPIICGLVIAGSGEFKHELIASGLLDYRLEIINVIDVSYGDTIGLNQAIQHMNV